MPEIDVRRMLPTELASAADLYIRSITGLLREILKPEQIRADHEYRGYFTDVVARDLELWVAMLPLVSGYVKRTCRPKANVTPTRGTR